MKRDLKPETIRLNDGNRCRASAQVLPGLGANLVSFRVDGIEFLHWNETAFLEDAAFSGAFNMFPTPCRLAGCSYEFEGRKIVQRKRGERVFIHGLIRDEAMESRNDGAGITSWLEIAPGHPVFEGFPFKCSFAVTHSLGEAPAAASGENAKRHPCLSVGFRLQNRDERNIPFGYGLHPYWRIHGTRKDVAIRIPCDFVMEQADLVPTGDCSPVSGTCLDLRSAKNLEGMELDNVFWERKPGDAAEIAFRAVARKIVIEADAEFTHMIAFTPPDKDYFCVESLTSCPNAPNLAAADKGRAAHMLVVPPGGTAQSWIKYTVVPLT